MRIERLIRSKYLPRHPVIFFPIRFEEGGLVLDGAFCWAAGRAFSRWKGVIHEGFADGAFGEVLDVFPAERDAGFLAVGGVEGVVGAFLEFFFAGLAGQADADQALAGGEDDATALVVVGFRFVLAHNGELHAVNGEQLFQREAEGLGDEDVDFYQSLTAGVVATQGVVALPVWSEIGEEILWQRGDRFAGGPVLLVEGVLPVGLPEVGVVVG